MLSRLGLTYQRHANIVLKRRELIGNRIPPKEMLTDVWAQ